MKLKRTTHRHVEAETIVKTHVDYKYKNCKVELIRTESEVKHDG